MCVCVGGGGVFRTLESRQDGIRLDLAPRSDVLLYDTLLTLVRFGVCVCGGGG